MARCYDNRLIETRKTALEDMEFELLGTKTKKECIEKLEKKYNLKKEKIFGVPNIEKDPDFEAYGINDVDVTRRLYHFLKQQKIPEYPRLQALQDELTKWAMKGITIPRTKIKDTLAKLERLQKQVLAEQID